MVGRHIGKYRVTSQIGRGGMGTVYHAVDESLQREVAIKVLNAELSDPVLARRFRAEAVTVARLNHPGIATIYELLQHDEQWLMVMEYVRGETLEGLRARKGPLPLPRAADLMMQTLAALAHAHSLGVVHRDLKPANLMLADNGLVKIMDFGIARVAGAEQLTKVGSTMGTPAYMSPEQLLGHEIDARTDLYAAGLVFYELIVGRLPFDGRTPMDIAQARLQQPPASIGSADPGLPAWVGHVMDIALARQPEQRYQTALFFREAVRRGLANLPIEHQVMVSVPPELVATAAPNALPIADVKAPATVPVVKHTMPPPAEMPTMAANVPEPDHASAVPAARRSVTLWAGVAAVLLAAVGGVAFVATRAPAQPQTVAAAPSVALASPASVPMTTPEPTPRVPVTAASPEVAPAPAPVLAAAPARVRPRVAVPVIDDTPAAFDDLRAFVVTGRKVEEREAALQLGDGRVSLVSARGGAALGSLAYADITAAAHSRGKNPLWYPTLAAPPSNVDMPGGLFRSDRHWLALQSRSGYLIVRLNDDYRRVIDALTGRLTVAIETLASPGP